MGGRLLLFLPPVSPPAPQLSRRSCRSYQVMREPCRSGPRFKGGGRGFCTFCAIRCVLIGHAAGRPDPQSRRAGSQSACGRRSSFALFALFCLAPSSWKGGGVGLGGSSFLLLATSAFSNRSSVPSEGSGPAVKLGVLPSPCGGPAEDGGVLHRPDPC